ncbi:MAG: deoxyguanosinetriphosphate triphosphohydrolase [bacterium]|nr:deoxyguanosinetriphosphate triphosphohydrolase [bacterium]
MLSNSPVTNFPVKTNARSPDGPGIAPYASYGEHSRGRLISEKLCPIRSPYARDRDRITHSNAFRRLNYKTQVFVYHEGDHFRSRLTHSLEVAQIARSLAYMLHFNEDLCEAISLAHDIGHTPFGHAGERALSRALDGFGGFNHNIQTLRTLTNLEKRYAQFDGLNLSWETLEGLIKHNGPLTDHQGGMIGKYACLQMPELLRWYELKFGFGLHLQAGPEGQVASIADDIAYNNHDIDDGLRAGLFELGDLQDVPFVWDLVTQIKSEFKGIENSRLVFELNRRLITMMLSDVCEETERRIDMINPLSSDAVREANKQMVAFSSEFILKLDQLRSFLYQRVYRHDRIMAIMNDAESVVEDLVNHYMRRPQDMPNDWNCKGVRVNINQCAERVRDFIAGMTDRYAIDLHRSLFDVTPKLR